MAHLHVIDVPPVLPPARMLAARAGMGRRRTVSNGYVKSVCLEAAPAALGNGSVNVNMEAKVCLAFRTITASTLLEWREQTVSHGIIGRHELEALDAQFAGYENAANWISGFLGLVWENDADAFMSRTVELKFGGNETRRKAFRSLLTLPEVDTQYQGKLQLKVTTRIPMTVCTYVRATKITYDSREKIIGNLVDFQGASSAGNTQGIQVVSGYVNHFH